MSEAKTHDIKCLISLIQFVYYARWQKLFFSSNKEHSITDFIKKRFDCEICLLTLSTRIQCCIKKKEKYEK